MIVLTMECTLHCRALPGRPRLPNVTPNVRYCKSSITLDNVCLYATIKYYKGNTKTMYTAF